MTALRLVTAPSLPGRDPDLVEYLHWGRELKGYSVNTVNVRGEVLDRLVECVGVALRDLTEDDLLVWERRAVAGRAPETRRAYVCHVRAFFAWAVKTRIVTRNPALVLTLPKVPRAVPRPMADEQLRAALVGARPKMRVWLLLGAFCGLRCVEIAGLTWTDLREDGEQPTLVVRGKGGDQRVVPVPAVVMAALDGYGRRRTGPMFYGPDGYPTTAKTVSHNINRFLQRRGIDATAHQLRHRYATTAYRLTRDLRLIQEMLGHRDPKTTARYAEHDKTHAAEMVRKLDETWEAGGTPTPPARPVTGPVSVAALQSLLDPSERRQ